MFGELGIRGSLYQYSQDNPTSLAVDTSEFSSDSRFFGEISQDKLMNGGTLVNEEANAAAKVSFEFAALNTPSYAGSAAGLIAQVGGFLSSLFGGCSFPSDTPVTTQDGLQPIGAVVTGTMVLAWDEATHTMGYYPVTAVWAHNDPVITVLDIDGEIIEATPEHPFYTPMHGWLEAKDLFIGVAVRKANGETGIVRQNMSVTHAQQMWNLTVADAHTYFVGNGQWLVHNAGGCNTGRGGKQQKLESLLDDPKQPKEVRGWVKSEIDQIENGNRTTIRVPPQYDLAHKRGSEARLGFDYENSVLQTKDLHRLQHKYEGYKGLIPQWVRNLLGGK